MTFTGTSSTSPVLVPNVTPAQYVATITASSAAGTSVSASSAPFTIATPPSSSMLPQGGPTGINWALKFDDEFAGTSLDTSKWNNHDGGSMNSVTTLASNIQVTGGNCILTLSDTSHGAEIYTTNYLLPVGGYVEFYAYFPGPGSSPGTTVYNWSAVWTSGSNWPHNGEIDIAEEGGGHITSTYHYYANGANQQHGNGTMPGNLSNSFHYYGMYRGSDLIRVYYDGVQVGTFTPNDSGGGQSIIANVGQDGNNTQTGSTGALRLAYVRAWEPA